jgi:hypothetical protein
MFCAWTPSFESNQKQVLVDNMSPEFHQTSGGVDMFPAKSFKTKIMMKNDQKSSFDMNLASDCNHD